MGGCCAAGSWSAKVTRSWKGDTLGVATDECKREACPAQTLSRVLPDWAGGCVASAERGSCQSQGGGVLGPPPVPVLNPRVSVAPWSLCTG